MDIAIIGAGVTGLSAAWALQQARPDLRVGVFEAAGVAGGKLRTERVDGYVIEAGPDSFLSRKAAGVGLCQELGIADQLIGRVPENRETFIKIDGRLHRLPEGLTGLVPTNMNALADSDLLSAAGVARFGQEREIAPLAGGVEESVEAFLVRRFGREAYTRLMEPLMGGIYGGRADLLSVDAIFPQLRQLEQTAGSVLAGLAERPPVSQSGSAYPPFVSFPDGMATLITALLTQLTCPIYTNTPIVHIGREHGNYVLTTAIEQEKITTDRVLITTGGDVAARLVRPFAPALADRLSAIDYASSVLVTVAYRGTARGYGYVVPRSEGSAVLACTFSSNKWAGRAPEGMVLARVFVGRFGIDATAWSDERLLALAREALGLTAAPVLTRIDRWHNGMPQYTLGHSARMAHIDQLVAAQPGLLMAGALWGGVGIPDCIRSGQAAAGKLVV